VTASLGQRCFAEALGTAFLLAAVVGSGIMAARLAGGNGALALLCNTLPTGAILTVLILVFSPISGAHFNPAVSIAAGLRGKLNAQTAVAYIGAQLAGGILGVWAAHLMFELRLWQVAATARTGPGQWLAEAVATFGLLLTIIGCSARTPAAVPYAVGLYITAAYWFTASTSFANPDDRAVIVGYFRRHCSGRRPAVHRGAAWRHAGSARARTLALARLAEKPLPLRAREDRGFLFLVFRLLDFAFCEALVENLQRGVRRIMPARTRAMGHRAPVMPSAHAAAAKIDDGDAKQHEEQQHHRKHAPEWPAATPISATPHHVVPWARPVILGRR
jgi:glycerol uptake facilitator-like aquaporin